MFTEATSPTCGETGRCTCTWDIPAPGRVTIDLYRDPASIAIEGVHSALGASGDRVVLDSWEDRDDAPAPELLDEWCRSVHEDDRDVIGYSLRDVWDGYYDLARIDSGKGQMHWYYSSLDEANYRSDLAVAARERIAERREREAEEAAA